MSQKRNSRKNNKVKGSNRDERFNNNSNNTNCDANDSDRYYSRGNRNNRGSKVSGSNDIADYSQWPQLVKDACSLPFAISAGMPINMQGTNTTFNPNVDNDFYVPGVMTVDTMITPGVSKDKSSIINIAATNVYSFIRHANSGSANYDAPDLMMYLFAVNSLYSMYSNCARIYGLASVYNVLNRHYPQTLLYALGVDYKDLTENLANYRARFNILVGKMGPLCVPANMKIFKNTSERFSGYYTDGDDLKAQLYMFRPSGYYTLSETGSTTGTSLVAHKMPYIGTHTVSKFSVFLDIMESQIQALVNSESMGIMSGDILKAYGSNVMVAAPITESYAILPAHDYVILSQIQNATITASEITTGTGNYPQNSFNVTQTSNGTIVFNPTFVSTTGLENTARILNAMTQDPNPAWVMEATRMINIPETMPSKNSEDEYWYNLSESSTNIVTGIQLFNRIYSNTGNDFYHHKVDQFVDLSTLTNLSDAFEVIAQMTQFDWFPTCYYYDGNTVDGKYVYMFNGLLGDLQNFTTLDSNTINQMHSTATASLLNVPLFGSNIGQ